MTSPKPFLSVGEVCQRLNILRSGLQNMYPYLPHLQVHRTNTRLFPTAYIEAFAAILHQHQLAATAPRARGFWKTTEARTLTKAARDRIEDSHRSTSSYRPSDLTRLLGVTKSTLNSWIQVNAIRVNHEGRWVIIPVSEVRRAIGWILPTP